MPLLHRKISPQQTESPCGRGDTFVMRATTVGWVSLRSTHPTVAAAPVAAQPGLIRGSVGAHHATSVYPAHARKARSLQEMAHSEIGRASCRDRVCPKV